jgi:hypothetical protein
MYCYTITEESRDGIRVDLSDEGEAYVFVGGTHFPVSSTIRDSIAVVLAEAKKAAESEGISEEERRALLRVANGGWGRILEGDLTPDEDRICKPHKDRRSSCALVLVDVATAEGGKIKFTSRGYNEIQWLSHSHVSREYHPWPVTGVQEVASYGAGKLLVMSPRSGFRIERSGDIDDAAPVLIVGWTGSRMMVHQHFSAHKRLPREQYTG